MSSRSTTYSLFLCGCSQRGTPVLLLIIFLSFTNACWQALPCARGIASVRGRNGIIGVHMRALSKTLMDTVHGTIGRDVYVLNMLSTELTMECIKAHTSSVITPSIVVTILGASSNTAVLSTEARFAPARATQAHTISRAVANANGYRTINSAVVRVAEARAVVAHAVFTAVHGACFVRAVDVGPAFIALACMVHALATRLAIIGA